MLNIDLTNVPFSRSFSVGALIVISIIGPYFFLFQFQRELFFQMDLLRLLFFCLAIGIPSVLVHLILNLVQETLEEIKDVRWDQEAKATFRSKEQTEKRMINAAQSTLVSVLMIFFVPCIGTFFTDISFNTAVFLALGITAPIVGAVVWTLIVLSRREKPKPPAWKPSEERAAKQSGTV